MFLREELLEQTRTFQANFLADAVDLIPQPLMWLGAGCSQRWAWLRQRGRRDVCPPCRPHGPVADLRSPFATPSGLTSHTLPDMPHEIYS